jgi:hypothetical protein
LSNREPEEVINSIEPTPMAWMAFPLKPLMGWGVMGRKLLKSERNGEMWHEAPVSIMKGSEGERALVEEETKRAEEEETTEEERETGREGEAKQTR